MDHTTSPQIEVNGRLYRALRMPPREQLHVFRRLSPLVGSMGMAVLGLLDDDKPKEQVILEMASQVGPMAEVLSQMADAQVDYVMDACLTRVERMDTDEKWHPIYVPGGRGIVPMYAVDVDLGAEMRLVAEVIKLNLMPFFVQLSGASASSLSAP